MGNELESAGSAGGGTAPGRRRPGRWVGAALAVVVIAIAVFVVAQAGGSDGGPLNAIAKAAEITQREPGGRATINLTAGSSTTGEGITESGSMIFEGGGRTRGTLTVRGHSTGREEKLLVVTDGTKSYVSSDQFDSIPEGKDWMELDFSSATKGMGSAVPAESGPKEGLQLLERVQGAKAVGKENIDGVPTTHYTGTLPAAEEVFGVKLDVSALVVDVWIDGQDRVRRMELVVSGGVEGTGVSTTTEMTIDYVSFGRVPKIGLPDPKDVYNATSEIESQFQESAEGH